MSKNNETTDGSFLSVLLALKENVMFNLNVADLAIVNDWVILANIDKSQVDFENILTPAEDKEITFTKLEELAEAQEGQYFKTDEVNVIFKFYNKTKAEQFSTNVHEEANEVNPVVDINTYICNPINNSNETISAVKLNNVDVDIGDCVLILFTNTDFRTNLDKIRKNIAPQDGNKYVSHSKENGVIIGIINKGESNND